MLWEMVASSFVTTRPRPHLRGQAETTLNLNAFTFIPVIPLFVGRLIPLQPPKRWPREPYVMEFAKGQIAAVPVYLIRQYPARVTVRALPVLSAISAKVHRLIVRVKGQRLQLCPAIADADVHLRPEFNPLPRLSTYNGPQERRLKLTIRFGAECVLLPHIAFCCS